MQASIDILVYVAGQHRHAWLCVPTREHKRLDPKQRLTVLYDCSGASELIDWIKALDRQRGCPSANPASEQWNEESG
jgi:hypothetical protein